MIISASRRTDIPAFYFDWFLHRLHEGFVDVKNPFNRKQVSRISLKPSNVDCIVFWTKDPAPMLKRLEELSGYPFYVQVSITPYEKDIETNLRSKREIIQIVQELSRYIGSKRVVWRYDPILVNERYSLDYHLSWFENALEKLSPFVNQCVISFIDIYPKIKKNIKNLNLHELDEVVMQQLAFGFSELAKGSGIALSTCSERIDLEKYKISHGACIDKKLIESITGKKLRVGKAKSQRPLCNCVESFDIGAYDTCIHGCHYCYANNSLQRAKLGFEQHDKVSTCLVGRLLGDEKITMH